MVKPFITTPMYEWGRVTPSSIGKVTGNYITVFISEVEKLKLQ